MVIESRHDGYPPDSVNPVEMVEMFLAKLKESIKNRHRVHADWHAGTIEDDPVDGYARNHCDGSHVLTVFIHAKPTKPVVADT
jgi:hypothetical protein